METTNGRHIMETLRNNLRTARKNKGWSLHAAEAVIGIKSVTIGSYERGYRLPPLNILQKLAGDYGVSIGWLMGEHCATCMNNGTNPNPTQEATNGTATIN